MSSHGLDVEKQQSPEQRPISDRPVFHRPERDLTAAFFNRPEPDALPSPVGWRELAGQSSSPGISNLWPRRRRLGQIAIALALALFGVVGLYGLPEGVGLLPAGQQQDITTVTSTPGVVIGSKGDYYAPGMTAKPPAEKKPPPEDLDKGSSLQDWGVDLASESLLGGLRPWPENPPHDENDTPLSAELGHAADDVYKIGPLTLKEYTEQLVEFVEQTFPPKVIGSFKERMLGFIKDEGDHAPWDTAKNIWQTDKDDSQEEMPLVKSWREGPAAGEDWNWDLLTDEEADKYVDKMAGHSRIGKLWRWLPSGILRSDLLRYVLLAFEGGIYSDTDTSLLKAPSAWGKGAVPWREGKGWLNEEQLNRVEAGEDINDILGPPSVVVGIEADVGGREDWHDWWPRPMQIVQWTMASAPAHPIAISALLRVAHETGRAIDWARQQHMHVKYLKELGRYDDAKALASVSVMAEPQQGGPVGVMAWTGPGVWTDATLSYLRVKYGLLWTDLKDRREPLRVGEVVILPVTGFSPGVGNFGAQDRLHPQAMVEHGFRGSWKGDERR